MSVNGRIIFVGAVHEAVAALDAVLRCEYADLVALVTTTDAIASRLSGAVELHTAVSARIPVIRTDDVNSPETLAKLRRLEPDLLIVVGWTRLIRDELLALPTRGCVGFHASLLPLHRGRAPVNWSLILGEHETGNTMMLLNAGADTGNIVDQRLTSIYVDDTCQTVYDRIGELGAAMLLDNLPALISGKASIRPQLEGEGDVLPKRVPAMGIIDWNRSPVDVHNWIRAQTVPYPGAFTHLGGRKVMVWRTIPPLRNDSMGHPGEILGIEGDGIRVATRAGSVVIEKISWETGDPKSVQAWALEARCLPGNRFDAPDPATAAWAHGLAPRPTHEGTQK